MAEYDIVHVAVAPPDTLEEGLARTVAGIIDKDLYGTRLLLAGKVPRIVAHYKTVPEAESIAQSLRALGLVAIVCNDSELRNISAVRFMAHTLEPGGGEIIFRDKAGRVKKVKAEDVFLILSGTRQTHAEKKAAKTKIKLNVPATLLTGGIPIWRKTKEEIKDMSVKTEGFVRLYDRTSSEPCVEILQYDFDYSFLAAKSAPSSFTNLNAVITELRNTFTQAVFDDRLMQSYGADVSADAAGSKAEINCKLVCLYHKVLSGHSPLR